MLYRATLITSIALACLLLGACNIMQGAQLEGAVVKALAADPRTKDFKFEVSQQNPGEVLITGEVYSPADIDAVTEIAAKVPGVTKVVNRAAVPEEGSGMMQDAVVPGIGGGLGF